MFNDKDKQLLLKTAEELMELKKQLTDLQNEVRKLKGDVVQLKVIDAPAAPKVDKYDEILNRLDDIAKKLTKPEEPVKPWKVTWSFVSP